MEDFEFPNEITDLSASFLTVAKQKTTNQLYYLQGVPLLSLSSHDRKALTKKIAARTKIAHPHILLFYEPIQTELQDVLHLKMEYCKYHTLSHLLQNECIQKGRRLQEQLLCRILYQTAFALKTVDCFMGSLNAHTVLLDEDFNVKLYNFFNVSQKTFQKQKEVKMAELGTLIFEACTLKTFDKNNESELQLLQGYSEAFKGLVHTLVKDQSEIKKHLNKILCDPTVLVQSSRWTPENSFINSMKETLSTSSKDEILERLRCREAALQIKEQLIKEQERKLANKEKRLQIMERTVKEKLQQAELYLKRCREGGKSISSGSSKSSNSQTSLTRYLFDEEADPNYVTVEDEVLPTSTKLQVDKIVKPSGFSRAMSERKIRFKTSPLKDRNFVRRDARKSVRHSKILEETEIIRPACDMNSVWNAETKKCAFDMLRILNSEDKENVEMKHTVL